MKTLVLFISYWRWNIPALFLSMVLIYLFLRGNEKRIIKKRNLKFFTGVFLLLVLSASPLDFLGRHYLFSAHMLEHVILLLIIPPLLLTGLDSESFENFAVPKWVKKTADLLLVPSVSWILGVGSMWVLHIPAVFTTIHASPALMTVQMFVLLILGTIFIWPVYNPFHFHKLSALESVVYLFTACTGCTVLGILITFTPVTLYHSCLIGKDPAILNIIRLKWGITPDFDQQIGGLIMWVPACTIYLTNILMVLGRWFVTAEEG